MTAYTIAKTAERCDIDIDTKCRWLVLTWQCETGFALSNDVGINDAFQLIDLIAHGKLQLLVAFA